MTLKYNSTEKFDKTRMTVWLVILFLKCPFVQLFKTKSTNKVFGVKFLVHSSNTSSCYRLLAAGTQRASLQVIMGLAVGLAFMIKETTASKCHATFLLSKLIYQTIGESFRCTFVFKCLIPVQRKTQQ